MAQQKGDNQQKSGSTKSSGGGKNSKYTRWGYRFYS